MNHQRGTQVLLVTVMLCLGSKSAQGQFAGGDTEVCGKQLEGLLLNRRLSAKVQFPAWVSGLDLTLDGNWNPKQESRDIKDHGMGIDINEVAVVNQVKLKKNLLEIQLNGGGFGTFGDVMRTSDAQRAARATMAKASGGSRLNLRFNRPITCEELVDAEKLTLLLAPLLDASSLKAIAALQSLSPEWAEAAAQHRVMLGMDKPTVMAILGEPKQKQVDLSGPLPTERWQYEMTTLQSIIVSFQGGKVVKIDEL